MGFTALSVLRARIRRTPWLMAASITLRAAHDIGLNRLERVVLAGRHLLQRGRVHHDRHARQARSSGRIPHVAKEIAQAGMIEARRPHVMLLQFVPAEDDQLFGRYSASMISTNFLPNEPVPPVTRTTCSDQFITPPHRRCTRLRLPALQENHSHPMEFRVGASKSATVMTRKYIGLQGRPPAHSSNFINGLGANLVGQSPVRCFPAAPARTKVRITGAPKAPGIVLTLATG